MRDHRQIKDALFTQFARLGKALSSPKRMEIIDLLSQGERPVEEVAKAADLTVGNASAQLKVLYMARLVQRRRDGQRVYYRIAGPSVLRLLRELQHVSEEQIAEVEQLVRLYYAAPSELEPVTPEELSRRLRQEDVLVLDVRPPEEYRAGHIPGAVNVPPNEMERRLQALPRNREIVAYCRGRYCLYSGEAVALLQRDGRRARRLSVGLPDWASLGLPIASLAEPA